jgi:hypothetical protein
VSNSNLAFWFVDQRSISMEILLATTHCDIAFRYSMNADALVVRYIFGMLLYSADLICATNASIAAIRLPTPDVAVAGSVAATTAPTASTTGTAAVTSDSTLETTSDTVSDMSNTFHGVIAAHWYLYECLSGTTQTKRATIARRSWNAFVRSGIPHPEKV